MAHMGKCLDFCPHNECHFGVDWSNFVDSFETHDLPFRGERLCYIHEIMMRDVIYFMWVTEMSLNIVMI